MVASREVIYRPGAAGSGTARTSASLIGMPPTLPGDYPEGGDSGWLRAIAKSIPVLCQVHFQPDLVRRETGLRLHVSTARSSHTSGAQPRPPGCAHGGLGGLGLEGSLPSPLTQATSRASHGDRGLLLGVTLLPMRERSGDLRIRAIVGPAHGDDE